MAATLETPDLLRVEDVSRMIGVSEDTLRHWRHRGTGPRSARLGRRIVYRRRDVEGWIDRQFETTGSGESADGTPAA